MTYIRIHSPKLNNIDLLGSIHNISLCMYMIIPAFCFYIHIEPAFLPTYLPTYRASTMRILVAL